MQEPITPTPPADEIAAALAYAVHFAEAAQYGATVFQADGATLFISPELVRAALPAEVAR